MMSDWHRDSIEVEEIGDVTVVNFTVRMILDEPTIQLVDEEFSRVADIQGHPKMLLNFRNIESMSTAALGRLIKLRSKALTAGGRLSLCNLGSGLLEIFRTTKLDKIFIIEPHPNEDASGGNTGGVTALPKPPQPSCGGAVSLQPPQPERDDLRPNPPL